MATMYLKAVLENLKSLSFSMSYEQFCQKLGLYAGNTVASTKHRSFVNIGTALQSLSPEDVVKLLGSSSSTIVNPYAGPENSLPSDDKTAVKIVEDLISYLTIAKEQANGNKARHYAICVTKLEDVLFRLKFVNTK